MKVVLVDNYARDSVADSLLQDGLSQEEAEKVAAVYNAKKNWFWYAVVVDDDYRLHRGVEDMI